MSKNIIAMLLVGAIIMFLAWPTMEEIKDMKYKSQNSIDSIVFVDINKDTFVIYASRYTDIIKR